MKTQEVIEILKKTKHHYNVKNFILFGSFATKKQSSKSDVDVAYVEAENSHLDYATYLALEEDLHLQLKRKIDLVNFKKLNPLVKLHAQDSFIYV